MKPRRRPMKTSPPPEPPPAAFQPSPHFGRWVAALFGLGALYQLLVLVQLSRSPYFGHPILDARYQVEWALALAAGRDPHAVFFQSPLYSYLLAGFFEGFGWRPWALIFLQWLSVLLVPVLLLATLRRLAVDARVSLAVVGFALFYPLLPYYAAFLHKTALEIVMHALVLWLAVLVVTDSGESRRALFLSLAFGFACGVAALVRSTFQPLALLPVLLARTRRWVTIACVALGFAGPVGWATLHNLHGAGEWVPLQTSLGFNLFLGNNPWNVEGALVPIPGLEMKPLEEESAARAFAERQAGRRLGVATENAYYVEAVRRYAMAQPGRFVATLQRKLFWYMHREELPDNDCYRCDARDTPALAWNPLHWGWLMLAAPGAMVLVILRWRWRKSVAPGEVAALLFPLWLLAAVLMFFVTSRFRVCHVVPWLAVIALGLDVAVRSWRTHGTVVVLAAALGALPGVAMLVQPELEYPPDEATLKLCLLYTDLDQFDLAEAQAMKLESRMTREAQLARIARFRQAPDDPARDRRLLGSVIPRDGRVPAGPAPTHTTH
jgi:hypothetical protein